jgi:hypothetical protein
MTVQVRAIERVLRGLRDGHLGLTDFIDRYSELWQALTRDQDRAIAAHPTVGPELPRLREMERNGAISTAEYLARVEQAYARLEGLEVVPGTAAAEALDQVYVLADAYLAGLNGAHAEPLVTESELREAAARALDALDGRGLAEKQV